MRRPRIFYGWYIVLVGMLLNLLRGGFYVYGFGVFYVPLLKELGTTRAALGGVIGLSRLEGGIIAPLAGWLIDRYGPRRLMFIGLMIIGLGFIVLSQITALWMLYVLFIVMAVGSSLGGGRAVNVAVANWFIRKRGRAMGILVAGFGLGGSLALPLAWLIDTFGWRTAAFIGGLSFWAIGFSLTWIVRHRPEEMGLLPDGDPPGPAQGAASAEGAGVPDIAAGEPEDDSSTVAPLTPSAARETNFTPRQALKTSTFWMLAIAYAGWSTIVTVVTVYQIPFWTEEVGVPYVTAAAVSSLFPLISIPGRIGFGWLADYVNVRLLLAGLFLTQAMGLVVLAQIPSLAWAPLYLLILAPAYGGTIPLRSVVVANFYGRRNFGAISGLLTFVDLPGSVLGPIFVGAVFDIYGTYRPGLLVVAVLMILGAGAFLMARRPQFEESVPRAVPT